MANIALALNHLLPGAAYRGSLTANTREAFDALDWQDARPKPTWNEVLAAEPDARRAVIPLPQLLDKLIAEGEAQMASDPLPDDIQEQIYDLRTLVLTYPPHKANLIRRKLQAFELPAPEDRPEITERQRYLVAVLQQQMLGLLE